MAAIMLWPGSSALPITLMGGASVLLMIMTLAATDAAHAAAISDEANTERCGRY